MKNVSLEQVAKVIGEDEVKRLIEAFPGGQIYLRANYLDIKVRNEIIRNDFYSDTIERQQLAEKYNLSQSMINKIISEKQKHKI